MKHLLLQVFLLILSADSAAQSLSPEQTTAIDKLLMADIPAGGPGGALGIVLNGKVVYKNSAGLADLDTERAIDGTSRFNIASNAKQFTAIATLKLALEGKLKLEDDIRKYLPELYPDVKQAITVANLINHTSGIRDVYNLWGFQGITWWKKTLNNDDALELLRHQRELNFEPGSRQLYSNSNYILLTHIIARVTGQSFKAYTDELFRELGLANTNFVNDHEDMGENVARPYFNFDTWTTYEWKTDLHGDGSLFSSLEDQLAWELALQLGETDGLPAELLAQSQLPVNTDADYGYGLEHGEYRGEAARWHDGSTGAWDASFIRFPEHKLTVIAADNSGKFGTNMLVRAVADAVLGDVFKEEAYPTEPAAIGEAISPAELTGTYLNDAGFAFRLKLEDGKLVLEREGRNDVELEPEAGNVYRQKYDPAFKQEFTRGEDGNMRVTAYYWAHPPYTLTRSTTDWVGYDFNGLDGEYHNAELDVTFKVSYTGGRNYLIKSGRDKLKGKLYKRDRMLADGGNNIEITRDAGGRVVELLINDDRTRNLRFARKQLRR